MENQKMRHSLRAAHLALLIAILPTCGGEEPLPQDEPSGEVTSEISGASLQGGQVGNVISFTYFSGTFAVGDIPQCDLSPYSIDIFLNGVSVGHQSLNLFGLGDGRCGSTSTYGPIYMGTYKIVVTHPSLGNNLSINITPVFPASSISANPTTVSIPYGQSTGSTLISWNAPGYPSVDVYVSEDGAAQTLTASSGTSGSRNVSSIAAGHQYKFLLYPGGHTTGALAQVTVTGQQLAAPTITANPPTVTIPCGQSLGSTAVSWNAPGYSSIDVYVSENGAAQTLMASGGSTGSSSPPWIQPGHSYTFNLYASGNAVNPLAQVTVSGQLAVPTINNFVWTPSTVTDGSLSLLTFDIANSDGAGRLACSGAFNFVIDPYTTVNFSHNYPNSTIGLGGQTFTCTLTARQAGCPDASQTRTLTIIAASQTINFDPIADQHLGASPVGISASASSGLPVSFSSSTPVVCTVSGNNVTFISTGICSITADQSGNNSYNAAASVTRSFTVDPPCPTINNFAWTPSFVVEGGDLSLLTFDIANSNGAGRLACSGAFNFVIDPYTTMNFSHNYPNSTTGLGGQTFTCTLTARQSGCADVTQSRTLTIGI